MSSPLQFHLVSDLDGVLAHSQPAIIETCNNRCGTQYRYEDWKYYEFISDEAMKHTGQTAAEVASWLYSSEVLLRAVPSPGAEQVVKEVIGSGGLVSIVTSRSPGQRRETEAWVHSRFLNSLSVNVRHPDESPESGIAYKVRMAEKMGATHYVDDDPAVINLVAERKAAGGFPVLQQVFLVDHPWNQLVELPYAVVRVGDWKHQSYGWEHIAQSAHRYIEEMVY